MFELIKPPKCEVKRPQLQNRRPVLFCFLLFWILSESFIKILHSLLTPQTNNTQMADDDT